MTNEITYAGVNVPVHVTVHSAGYGGERVLVSLRNGAAILDEKALTLDSGTREYLVPLSIMPEHEGMQHFSAEVSSLPGELTLQNNRLKFFMKVLKSKLKVALIAGSPSQDGAFIRRALMGEKNYEVVPYIERSDGTWYENTLNSEALKAADCLVLVGFPAARSSSLSVQAVVDAAASEKPLLLILGRTIDYGKLLKLDPFLPFRVENPASNELQVFAAVPELQVNNPILDAGGGRNVLERWSQLPPIFRMQGTYRAKIGSEVLATVRLQSTPLNEPLIVAGNENKKKSLAILGYGLWRWTMLSDAGSDRMLDHVMDNAVRWLTTQEDSRRIRVQSSKRVYTTQDAIEFTAQVYDENYQPLDDAQVEVHVRSGSDSRSFLLNALGSGQYQGELESAGEGEYTFTATISVHGTELGNDQGSFSVGGLNAEFLETRMNKTVLQQIAAQTGGRYYDGGQIAQLAEDIAALPNFKPRESRTSAELEIWNSRWMLAVVVSIFALEWFLRKRSGML